MASNRKAKTMQADDVRADACARLRKLGNGKLTAGDQAFIGKAAAGWRLSWTDGSAAICTPDADHATRPQLPAAWAQLLAQAGDGQPAVQWQPYTGIGQAVHVLQAVAKGLGSQHLKIDIETGHKGGELGRVVLRYHDRGVEHTASAWADAAVYAVPQATPEERAAALQAASSKIAIPYLTALLWADSAEWMVRRVTVQAKRSKDTDATIPALMFMAPEVRVLVAEVA